MNEPYFNILVAILGGALGFGLKWFLAERQERYELRRSIAQMRAEAYKSLWVLCKEKGLTSDELPARIEALWNWYNNGGGLFLSLAASKRFFAAVNSIQKENLSEEEKLKVMLDNLTWLRTEMKYHVGSYTRREKSSKIVDAVPTPNESPNDQKTPGTFAGGA
jgi:hypothetical protein